MNARRQIAELRARCAAYAAEAAFQELYRNELLRRHDESNAQWFGYFKARIENHQRNVRRRDPQKRTRLRHRELPREVCDRIVLNARGVALARVSELARAALLEGAITREVIVEIALLAEAHAGLRRSS